MHLSSIYNIGYFCYSIFLKFHSKPCHTSLLISQKLLILFIFNLVMIMNQSFTKAIQVSKCILVTDPTKNSGSSLLMGPSPARRVHVHVCRLSERCAIVSVDSCICPEGAMAASGQPCVDLPAPTTSVGPLSNLSLVLTCQQQQPVKSATGAATLPPSLHTCIYETAESARTLGGSVSERMAASVLRALALPIPLQLFFSLNVQLPTSTDTDLNAMQPPQASFEIALVRCLRDILC